MKRTITLAVIVFWTLLFVTGSTEAKRPQHRSKPSSALPAVTAHSGPSTKTVQYGEKDVIKLKTKVRFTTLIVLPQNEEILDFTCGDKEFWVVNGNQNFAYVKPAKEGTTTNLNLITAAGNIYSFVLTEVSNDRDAEPDIKVFVEPKEQSMIAVADQSPRFVSARELDNYRQQVAIAKEETLRTRETAQAEKDALIEKFLSETRFTYRFDPAM